MSRIALDRIDCHHKPPGDTEVDWGNPINNGLVGWWPMNNAENTTVTDVITRRRGTYVSPAVLWGAGDRGPALFFNGITGNVTVPNHPAATVGTYLSATCRVKYNAISGVSGILMMKSPINSAWALMTASDLIILRGSSTTGPSVSTTTTGLTDLNWHSIGATWNNTTGKIYVDGREVVSGTIAAASATADDIHFGAFEGNSFPFSGLMDEVRIWNRVLTPGETQRVQTQPGLGYYYPRRLWIPTAAAAVAATPPPAVRPRVFFPMIAFD